MTEHITVSRELLRQAFDALREIAWSNDSKWQSDRAQAMTEPLRNALEQPAVEPVADGWQLRYVYFQDGEPTMHKEAPQAQCKHCTKFFSEYRCNASHGECDCPKCQGFCTCSQQPQLLTDEEIKDAIRHLYQDETALDMSMDITLQEFRAIEQAVHRKMGVGE